MKAVTSSMLLSVSVAILAGLHVAHCAYLPVFAMHGFSYTNSAGTYHDYDDIVQWLGSRGQLVIPLNINNGVESMTPMWKQVNETTMYIQSLIAANASLFANGYHFLGHSQGGLLMRCVIQNFDNHNVHTFVSMAGVQLGVYGLPTVVEKFLPESILRPLVTDLAYDAAVQDLLSVANYWHDVQDLPRYEKDNVFLPIVNNINHTENSARYKANFLRVKKFAFFGSPDDTVVNPWMSTLFGFYAADGTTMVDMTHQPEYQLDSFGLQTAVKGGRVVTTAVPGIEHSQWLHNHTNFDLYVAPQLEN